MRLTLLSAGGIALLMFSSACSKKTVAASHPPDTTPVAQAPAPARTPTRATPPAAPVQTAQTPRRRVMTPQERATLNEELAKLEDALFDYNKSTIRPDANVILKDDVGVIRSILANYPSQKLQIEGHCDERGSEEYNMALGDRRARAVEDFLTQMGIPNNQLTLISYGKDRPVCTDQTEDCWQRNRRAHVTAAP
jgi:peptidoglycan-associated lipoprotein